MNPGSIPRRVSLLSCSEIHVPPLLAPRRACARVSPPAAKAATVAEAAQARSDSDDHDAVALVWMPPEAARAPMPTRPAYASRAVAVGCNDTHDADLLNAWLCPEVSARIQRERARRRKALLVSERMGALVQAERQRQQQASEGPDRTATRRGRKRVHSGEPQLDEQKPTLSEKLDPAVSALMPASPELMRPQSLLIPELLPKGMLRVRLTAGSDDVPSMAAPAGSASPASGPGTSRPLTQPPLPPTPQTAQGSGPPADGPSLGLGLDLGFDIALPACAGSKRQQQKQQPGGCLADTSAAIMEIADFLERDIDVFTPTAVARTPRSAVFPVPTAPLSASAAGPPPRDKQQELIDDILNLSFARPSP